MAVQNWHQVGLLPERKWTCGHCGLHVANNAGYYRAEKPGYAISAEHITTKIDRIMICPMCEKPTYFFDNDSKQAPGVSYGAEVAHLPPDIDGLYREARNCISVSAFTASVLVTRKLLMNVAVHLGAPENSSFLSYVNYLEANGYVSPKSRGWVDHIRLKANEATHEIPAISDSDAKELVTFMSMILKTVFEFPSMLPKAAGS